MSAPEEKRAVHPIVELAASYLTGGGEHPYELSESAQERITAALEQLIGSSELKTAAGDLARLACWLETEVASPGAADVVLASLEVIVDPLNALFDESDPESLSGTKQRFDRFRDAEASAKAPRVGENAPAGSVKLGTLDYKKRG